MGVAPGVSIADGLASGVAAMAGVADISGLAAGELASEGEGIAAGVASAAAGVVAAASGDGPELTGVLSASTSLFWQEMRRAADRTVTKDLARAFIVDTTSFIEPGRVKLIRVCFKN